MHETVRHLGNREFHITALMARWRAPTATLTWINCGHPPAYLVDTDGNLASSKAPSTRRSAPRTQSRASRPPARLRSGERLILVTNGIVKRRIEGGGTFGVDGLERALERAESPTAAATAMAIQQAVTDCWREPLEDDATVVVMAVD